MPDKPFPGGVNLSYSPELKMLGDDGTQPGDVPASIFARDAELADVAKSGSYNDLSDKPDLSNLPSSGSGAGILSGTTAPANTLGSNGAFYIRTGSSPSLYGPKAAGVWPAPVSLVGPSGSSGGLLSGSAAPTAGVGEDGQFYLRTGATPALYGPKAAGAWPAAVSLVGPPGPAGAVSGLEEVSIPNGTLFGTDANGNPIGVANRRVVPMGLDAGAPTNGQIFKGPVMPFPYRVLGIYGRIEGTTPSVVATLKIGATDVTGLVNITYNLSSATRVNATGNNTGAMESELNLIIAGAPGGTVTRAAFFVIIEQLGS